MSSWRDVGSRGPQALRSSSGGRSPRAPMIPGPAGLQRGKGTGSGRTVVERLRPATAAQPHPRGEGLAQASMHAGCARDMRDTRARLQAHNQLLEQAVSGLLQRADPQHQWRAGAIRSRQCADRQPNANSGASSGPHGHPGGTCRPRRVYCSREDCVLGSGRRRGVCNGRGGGRWFLAAPSGEACGGP